MLYEANVGYLSAVCSRYISDDDDVKDLLQDAFIKIFDNIGRFSYRGEGSLRAWMSRIVVNEALKSLRPRRNLFRLGETSSGLPARDLPDEDGDPPVDEIPVEALLGMIRALPEGYRTVFNLFVFEDKSHKEIARMLGIKENSSASQLHHAKAQLTQWIKDYKQRHGDG